MIANPVDPCYNAPTGREVRRLSAESIAQYAQALRAGQKYYHAAVSRGEYPYPVVLDDILSDAMAVGREELGAVDVPTELIVGTRSAGRSSALAGNFMPLLPRQSEFAAKWIALCDAHLSDEGIRDPIRCFEYMGRFYVQEGNKRLSVLKSFGAPAVPALVTRILPAWSEDHEVQVYYEFLRFYRLSRLYSVTMNHRRSYARLVALLGMEPDHVWTDEERRRFSSGFALFRQAFEKCGGARLELPAGEALLAWLQLFPFSGIRDMSLAELCRSIESVWPDLKALADRTPIEVSVQPEEPDRSLLARIWGGARPEKVRAAFIYANDPEGSEWTRSHEHGRTYLERAMPDKVTTDVYIARDRDYRSAMEEAAAAGADVIFATTPAMIDACRRTAAEHKELRVLNCSLSQPFPEVRTYYSRLYETKFITGAIAGAMAAEDTVGYIAGYPILGAVCAVNAFALGARLTNPRARVRLAWSCLPEDPLAELISEGISVISNREATTPRHPHWSMAWGTYRRESDGTLLPLAVPCWNWGRFYEKVIASILNGTWGGTSDRAINYWWGLESGVLDIQYSDALPEGVRALADILRSGIIRGTADPFLRSVRDQSGELRLDGVRSPSPEELMNMDWLCESVDGFIPGFDMLRPESRELVRLLGVYRYELPPLREEAPQL